MNHLPLRHEMYHNKLNIPFAIHTLHKDLEEKVLYNIILYFECIYLLFKT